jgi:hypothetical protein
MIYYRSEQMSEEILLFWVDIDVKTYATTLTELSILELRSTRDTGIFSHRVKKAPLSFAPRDHSAS